MATIVPVWIIVSPYLNGCGSVVTSELRSGCHACMHTHHRGHQERRHSRDQVISRQGLPLRLCLTAEVPATLSGGRAYCHRTVVDCQYGLDWFSRRHRRMQSSCEQWTDKNTDASDGRDWGTNHFASV